MEKQQESFLRSKNEAQFDKDQLEFCTGGFRQIVKEIQHLKC